MMVKKFPHPSCVVLLISWFSQPVIFSFVLEHHNRISEASQSIEVLNSLVPVYCTIIIVVKDNKRCFHVLGIIDRGVSGIGLYVIPVAALEPSLATFKNRLVG